jgi:polysaccharide biosynthesis protein PslG
VAGAGVLVALLAVWLVAATAAQAARSEFFGIASGGPPLDSSDASGMAAAKVHTDRFLLAWKTVEPTRNTFQWSSVDSVVGLLASHGVRSAPFIFASPSWAATGGTSQPPRTASAEQGWRTFLKAAVARYGPGGTYWGTPYHQQYGAGATAYPIQSWQIWNEPNLKLFYPNSTAKQKAQRYARLVQVSHDAIKSSDSNAQIVLAGLTTQKDPTVYTFLNEFYNVPGIKNDFDAAAQHPYDSTQAKVKTAIQRFRAVMVNHGDRATPLWITEFTWGSAPPDSSGVNKGLAGQAQALTTSYKMFLANRTVWNLQRVYWFLWRDVPPGDPYANQCSFCGSAGLLNNDRSQKPSYNAFTAFTADTTKPHATITAGPKAGSTTHDPTPTFSFTSTETGSTFQCHFDSKAFTACASPFTPGVRLTKGAHTFNVKAIDAAGNESIVASRAFKVG